MKLKAFFKGLKDPWKILLHAFLLLTAIFYGSLIGKLIAFNTENGQQMGSNETIFGFVILIIISITLLRFIYPSYKPLKEIFPKSIPISKWSRYLVGVISDFQQSYFFYFLLFIFSGFWSLLNAKLLFLCLGTSALFSAHLLGRIVQYFIEKRINPSTYLFAVVPMGLVTFMAIKPNIVFEYYYFFSVLAPFLLFPFGYYVYSQIIENKKTSYSSKPKKSNIYLKLLFNNPKSRTSIIMAFVFKFGFIIAEVYMFTTKGKHLLGNQPVLWLFVSPLILFTYVFNNTWGFWQSVWVNFQLKTNEFKDLMKFGLRLFTPLLLLDMSITLPALYYSQDDFAFIAFFYFSTLTLFLSYSFVWSLAFPIVIKSSLQMKGSSSFIASLGSFLFIGLVYLLKYFSAYYWAIPVIIAMAFLAFKIADELYRTKKHTIADKLLK